MKKKKSGLVWKNLCHCDLWSPWSTEYSHLSFWSPAPDLISPKRRIKNSGSDLEFESFHTRIRSGSDFSAQDRDGAEATSRSSGKRMSGQASPRTWTPSKSYGLSWKTQFMNSHTAPPKRNLWNVWSGVGGPLRNQHWGRWSIATEWGKSGKYSKRMGITVLEGRITHHSNVSHFTLFLTCVLPSIR